MSNAGYEELIAAAKNAAANAYAPYSRFHVGAAIRLKNGSIVTGSNLENTSYGLSLCAETVAIANANSAGNLKQIEMIAVAGGPFKDDSSSINFQPITPCGRCRQIINEVAGLCKTDLPVYCATHDSYTRHHISALLPHGFDINGAVDSES